VAIAILSFLVWGHHMFASGQSTLAGSIFSGLTFLIAIPTAIKVLNWISTLYKGAIHLDTPMLYALIFLWVFTIGGVTGLFLSTMSTDIHLHDTYFVVAHFHYVMMGGAITAFFGGLHYWWPKMFGRMYNERTGQYGAIGVFVGLNMTFFPQFIMGSRGMPRRYYNYIEEFQSFHVWSTIGAYVLGFSFLVTVVSLLRSLVKKPDAPMNPWGSNTLEWTIPSPPPWDNFAHVPEVTGGPYEYDNWKYDEKTGGYELKTKAAEA
jgi:cytochrome c oxidase subunit 1